MTHDHDHTGDDCPECYPVLMTRDEYEAAFRVLAEAAGLRWLGRNLYALPDCGRLELKASHVETRTGWCVSAWYSLTGVRWDDVPALARLRAACADLPAYYGHERREANSAPGRYVPAAPRFGDGGTDDTRGT